MAETDGNDLIRRQQAAVLAPTTGPSRRTRPVCSMRCTNASSGHSRPPRPATAPATALATHVAVEDELLYPALRDRTGRHDAEELIGQHLSRYLPREERERLGLRMMERVGQLEAGSGSRPLTTPGAATLV